MKKVISITIICLMVISMIGCGGTTDVTEEGLDIVGNTGANSNNTEANTDNTADKPEGTVDEAGSVEESKDKEPFKVTVMEAPVLSDVTTVTRTVGDTEEELLYWDSMVLTEEKLNAIFDKYRQLYGEYDTNIEYTDSYEYSTKAGAFTKDYYKDYWLRSENGYLNVFYKMGINSVDTPTTFRIELVVPSDVVATKETQENLYTILKEAVSAEVADYLVYCVSEEDYEKRDRIGFSGLDLDYDTATDNFRYRLYRNQSEDKGGMTLGDSWDEEFGYYTVEIKILRCMDVAGCVTEELPEIDFHSNINDLVDKIVTAWKNSDNFVSPIKNANYTYEKDFGETEYTLLGYAYYLPGFNYNTDNHFKSYEDGSSNVRLNLIDVSYINTYNWTWEEGEAALLKFFEDHLSLVDLSKWQRVAPDFDTYSPYLEYTAEIGESSYYVRLTDKAFIEMNIPTVEELEAYNASKTTN